MQKNQQLAPIKLKGFQDLFDQPMQLKTKLIEKITQKAHCSGFNVMDTPCLEYSTTLLGQDLETDKQVFRFNDNGNRDVALRFDLTVPFARFVAEHQGKLSFPFKRFQYGKVWRAEKPQKGRYREFAQCDFDLIGIKSKWADLEIISLFYTIFEEIIKQPFTMKIGHRPLVSKVIRSIYTSLSQEKEQRILINLDKLLKIGKDKVCSLICNETQTSPEQAKKLVDILSLDLNSKKGFEEFKIYLSNVDEASLYYLDDLKLLKDFTENSATKQGCGKIDLDLTTVRGLGYYTGVVFETFLHNFLDFGSVCSGGRYDNITSRFTNKEFPGIGGSIGIDRLVAALTHFENNFLEQTPSFFIATSDSTVREFAHKVLHLLRNNNIRTEINLKEQKLGQQFKFAHKKGYTYVITIGEEELTKQSISLKEMSSGHEEKNIEINNIIPKIKLLLR